MNICKGLFPYIAYHVSSLEIVAFKEEKNEIEAEVHSLGTKIIATYPFQFPIVYKSIPEGIKLKQKPLSSKATKGQREDRNL